MNTQYYQCSYYFVVCGSKCLGVQFEFQFELMATVSNLVSCIVACRSIKSFCVPWWIAALSKLSGYVLRHTYMLVILHPWVHLVWLRDHVHNMDVEGVFLKWVKELFSERDGATRCFDATWCYISSGTSRKLPPIRGNSYRYPSFQVKMVISPNDPNLLLWLRRCKTYVYTNSQSHSLVHDVCVKKSNDYMT